MKNKTVCVIGMGYIGLPTATILADCGYSVYGIDNNNDVVEHLKKGRIHINEPKLDELFKKVIKNGSLTIDKKIKPSDIYLICVPTPLSEGNTPQPDLSYVFDATNQISVHVKSGDIVILESTSPVGTTEILYDSLTEDNIASFSMGYCPERVMPGNIIEELVSNARVVGGVNNQSTTIISEFYKSFVKSEIHPTDSKTAEMCKLVENSFRDVNIAFANEISLVCQNYDINPGELISLANRHPRVNILNPGIGVGGHCIAVDPWFLISSNTESTRLMKQARETNLYKTQNVIKMIKKYISDYEELNYKKPRIAFFGLSYKPDSDDLRCSPALDIVESISEFTNTLVVEPNIDKHDKFELFDGDYARKNSDLCVFLVSHSIFLREFTDLVFEGCKILDFCGVTNEAADI